MGMDMVLSICLFRLSLGLYHLCFLTRTRRCGTLYCVREAMLGMVRGSGPQISGRSRLDKPGDRNWPEVFRNSPNNSGPARLSSEYKKPPSTLKVVNTLPFSRFCVSAPFETASVPGRHGSVIRTFGLWHRHAASPLALDSSTESLRTISKAAISRHHEFRVATRP
jgi:hypothetical protein